MTWRSCRPSPTRRPWPSRRRGCTPKRVSVNARPPIWRCDDGRDGLVAYRASGMPIERISHVVVKPGQGLAGRVLKERKPLWTRQLTRSLQDDAPDASETATALGLQAALAAPIVSGEEAYGVLVVYRRAADDFALREVM